MNQKAGKKELVARVASNKQCTMTEAQAMVDATIDAVTELLAEGRSVGLSGFGSFVLKHTPRRMGRNVRTGEPAEIPAQITPRFRAGAILKRAVAEKQSAE